MTSIFIKSPIDITATGIYTINTKYDTGIYTINTKYDKNSSYEISFSPYEISFSPYKISFSPYISAATLNVYTDSATLEWPRFTPSERLKQIMRDRQFPIIVARRNAIVQAKDPRELRARETLRHVIGEQQFRRFLKDGHLTVRAKSGLVYQIFPGSGITNVYSNGKKIERLCVVLQGAFPPTDSLIVRFLLILNDEEQFRSLAIKHSVSTSIPNVQLVDNRSLPEIFSELKKVA